MRMFSRRIKISDFISFAENRLDEYFTEWERSTFKLPVNAGSLAARYILKSMLNEHAGWTGLFTKIEIINDTNGKPMLKVFPVKADNYDIGCIDTVQFSLSHSKEFAAAMLVIN
ncbi:MAG: hypothetical protein WCM76_09485 [Bacteroidota bacterium]